MIEAAVPVEHYLRIGELHFDQAPARIRTLLGSCVAITLWHPRLAVGGMCHYLLPSRPGPRGVRLDARYGDEAVEILVGHLERRGTQPADFVAKIFGGASALGGEGAQVKSEIGGRNARAGRELLERHGFTVTAEHVGGSGHRNILLDLGTGQIKVAHARLGRA